MPRSEMVPQRICIGFLNRIPMTPLFEDFVLEMTLEPSFVQVMHLSPVGSFVSLFCFAFLAIGFVLP